MKKTLSIVSSLLILICCLWGCSNAEIANTESTSSTTSTTIYSSTKKTTQTSTTTTKKPTTTTTTTTKKPTTTTTTKKPTTTTTTTTKKPTTTTTKAPIKIYGPGETWVVENEFTLTLNKATHHHRCNQFSEHKEEPTVLVNYTYENIGSSRPVYITSMITTAYDGSGEAALGTYPCTHELLPQQCIVGTKCTAEETWVFNNKSDSIMLSVSTFTSNYERVSAIFKIPVTD